LRAARRGHRKCIRARFTTRRAAKGVILAHNARRCHGRGGMQPLRTPFSMSPPPSPLLPDTAIERALDGSSAAATHIAVYVVLLGIAIAALIAISIATS
jgi:hypothetical protein